MPINKHSSRLEIKWQDCVKRPLDFLIFGPPSVDVRLFRVLFKERNDLTTVFRIFRQVALEVWGDKELSQALIAEYRRKQVAVVKAEKVKLDSKLSDPLTLAKDCTFVGTDKVFFDPLDDLFRTCVTDAFVSMQKYVDPIVTKKQLDPWKAKAKEIFPHLWSSLSNSRGINENCSRGEHLIEAKEWQVFFTILQLGRAAHVKRLTWWAFILSLANMTRGVSQKAGNINNYFGICLSRRAFDRMIKELLEDILSRQVSL